MSLIDRIRAARQTRVELDGKVFIVRRPTDWEVIDLGAVRQMDILERFVEGWEGFKELDLVPGGDAVPVEFDKELFAEWVQDHPEVWGAITTASLKEYENHSKRMKSSKKK